MPFLLGCGTAKSSLPSMVKQQPAMPSDQMRAQSVSVNPHLHRYNANSSEETAGGILRFLDASGQAPWWHFRPGALHPIRVGTLGITWRMKRKKKVVEMSDPSGNFYYLPVSSLISAGGLFSSFARDCLHPDVVPYYDTGILSAVKTYWIIMPACTVTARKKAEAVTG